MAEDVDKIVVINRAAMTAKYGAAGVARIEAALTRLVAADAGRALTTRVIAIDDAGEMTTVGGAAVIAPADQSGAKRAVDAIWAALTPDYVLLLDGPDVIPHIALKAIPGLTDDDATIPSDLPYACSAGPGTTVNRFLAVDRVVGRLPAAEAETDAAILVGLIDMAVVHAPRPAADHSAYFAITADVWTASTRLSVNSVFSNHADVRITPPSATPKIDKPLGTLTHFINCHGAEFDPRFYGQKDQAFPIAMESGLVTRRARAQGTVVAAECCYGAQLYPYVTSAIDQPICMAYLRNGAAAFLGSTNIAYGKNDDMGQADLMCRYFLEGIMAGASTGRAFLQARQQFVLSQVMADPMNLKTLAQFVLLGDPSLQPVELALMGDGAPKAALAAAGEVDVRSQRRARRIALSCAGKSIASAASLPGRRMKLGPGVAERFRTLARENGFGDPVLMSVTGGSAFRRSMKGLHGSKSVIISVDAKARGGPDDAPFPLIRVMVGHILGDGVRVMVSESR